eukprot:2551404-Lingulodinium_polyedra.AAC.1
MEAVLRVVRAVRRSERKVATAEVLDGVVSLGLARDIAALALENWIALGAWGAPDGYLWLEPGT